MEIPPFSRVVGNKVGLAGAISWLETTTEGGAGCCWPVCK